MFAISEFANYCMWYKSYGRGMELLVHDNCLTPQKETHAPYITHIPDT